MTVSDGEITALLNEELMARRTKVMFLRNAGATWEAIGKEVGVATATARNDYRVVCRDINNEQPADVVARHRAVIFDIQRANYPAMMRGDKDAAATILRALDREAKLLGLDAPTRVLAAVSGEDFANEAARLISRIQELDADTLKELERGHRTDAQVIDAEVGDPDPDPDASGADGLSEGESAEVVAGPGSRPGRSDDRPPAGPGADLNDGDGWSNI